MLKTKYTVHSHYSRDAWREKFPWKIPLILTQKNIIIECAKNSLFNIFLVDHRSSIGSKASEPLVQNVILRLYNPRAHKVSPQKSGEQDH